MAPRPDEPDDGVQPAGADVPPSTPDAVPDDVGATDEEAWAAIVAQLSDLDGYGDETETGVPDSATTDEPPAEAAPAAGLAFPVAPWVADRRVVRPAHEPTGQPELSGRDWDGTSQYDEAEAGADDREHFVPPDPGPVLGGDPLLTMAWFAAAGMPIFLLVVLVAWRDAPAALVQAAAVVFVIGIGVLVWRMPHRRDPDDDDTGAVV